MCPDKAYTISDVGILTYFHAWDQSFKELRPAEIIPDQYLGIGKVGQQNILPTHFNLKPKDLELTQLENKFVEPMGEPIPPGLSAFIYFGSKDAQQDSLDSLAKSHLNREISKKNRLYVTMVGDVIKAGWIPYFAPLICPRSTVHNPLHCILTPLSMIADPLRTNATDIEKQNLADSFVRWTNL